MCAWSFFVIIWTTFAYFQVQFNEKVHKGTVIIYQLGAVGGLFWGDHVLKLDPFFFFFFFGGGGGKILFCPLFGVHKIKCQIFLGDRGL